LVRLHLRYGRAIHKYECALVHGKCDDISYGANIRTNNFVNV